MVLDDDILYMMHLLLLIPQNASIRRVKMSDMKFVNEEEMMRINKERM